ncbi:serine hydrolase domain-containing protein [Rhizobium hainanense]|uniref:CubicO group peptidase, beta-lactamase class C family n=1 Tax=Rhizobium hainanense TaxID=52131 RepID=A0A1C3WGL7_9HYPH|nr:serine hydrolase domain-containing protein [Rhizobium hainanense]SCB39065.1 CubicO group peptidase, beta-lactamase class C family [Rhizobium hainanense]
MPVDRRSFIFGALVANLYAGHSSASETLAELTTQLATESENCSIAVTTLKDGRVAETFSASSTGTSPPGDAVYQAASLGKPLVAFMTLRMVERRELTLDTPLDQLLPNGYPHHQNIFALKAAPIVDVVPVQVLRLITPRMLLSHTAGFPNWSPSAPLVPEFTPGSRWQYSGEGYVLLQHILETISGHPLQELAEQDLFGPIQMTNSAFKITDAIRPRLVVGSPRQLRFPFEIASSSLYITANDYARFLESLLNDETMLSSTVANLVTLPTSWESFWQSTSLAWGLGWGVETRNKPVSLFHWGSNPGFRSLVLADLQSRDAIIVLTSSEKGMRAAKTLVKTEIHGEHPALDISLIN